MRLLGMIKNFISGCCDKTEIVSKKTLITIPNKGNPHVYDVNIVYCKNCGSKKTGSCITHLKAKNNGK